MNLGDLILVPDKAHRATGSSLPGSAVTVLNRMSNVLYLRIIMYRNNINDSISQMMYLTVKHGELSLNMIYLYNFVIVYSTLAYICLNLDWY